MKKTTKICPKCGCGRFHVVAHVEQLWEVNSDGNVEDVLADCEDVIHEPNDEDVWTCADCGYQATGDHFNTSVNDKTPEDLLVYMLQDLYREKGEEGVVRFAENYGCSPSSVADIVRRVKTAPIDVKS